MRLTRSPCCARAAIGQPAAVPPITLMKSRRLIVPPDRDDDEFSASTPIIKSGICDQRYGPDAQFALQKLRAVHVCFGSESVIRWSAPLGPDRLGLVI